jgi:chromosome segregation ATPase
MRQRFVPGSAFLALATLIVSGPASSQEARSGGNDQLVRQMQQLASERTDLQAQNDKLQKDLEAAKQQLLVVKQQLDAAKAGTARSQSEVSAARAAADASRDNNEKALADAKSKMQDLVDHYRATVVTLRDTETERAQLRQQLVQTNAGWDQCAQRNDSISKVTNEVLDRYAHEGLFTQLGRAEPFTQLKRTQIENLVLEDRQRVAELRVKQPPPVAPSAPAAQGVQFRADGDGH